MATTPDTAKLTKKARSQGSVRQLKLALYSVIRECERRVLSDIELTELTRLAHALATASGAWLRANEQGDILARLEELEKTIEGDL